MEMQFFVTPGEELEWFEYWKKETDEVAPGLGLRGREVPFPRSRQAGALRERGPPT